MVYGLRLTVYGLWVHGLWFLGYRLWFMAEDLGFRGYGFEFKV